MPDLKGYMREIAKSARAWEVYDVNTGETMHTFRNELEARLCANDLNKPHLDKLYKVRKA